MNYDDVDFLICLAVCLGGLAGQSNYFVNISF